MGNSDDGMCGPNDGCDCGEGCCQEDELYVVLDTIHTSQPQEDSIIWREAGESWKVAILVACVVMFTVAGITWSQGWIPLFFASIFWSLSAVLAALVIFDGELE